MQGEPSGLMTKIVYMKKVHCVQGHAKNHCDDTFMTQIAVAWR